MADTFNEMIKLETEDLERELRLILHADKMHQRPVDFDAYRAPLYKLAKSRGMSEKGSRAWASLTLFEFKKGLDELTRPD